MGWYVQEDDEVRRLSEKKLRKRLRKNDLSGLKLAPPERHLARARVPDPGPTREAHRRPRSDGAHELAVADASSEAIPRARRCVDELRARRAEVERKLEALHLDLVRAEAEDTALADLTGPLEDLRIELDAAREVEELLR